MKLTIENVKKMLKKAKKADACSEALTEIRCLLDEGGVEAVLASDECSWWAYWYAENVLKTRWPEAEDEIQKDAYAAYAYAVHVIKGRWPEAEDLIRRNAWVAYNYAKHFKFEWSIQC